MWCGLGLGNCSNNRYLRFTQQGPSGMSFTANWCLFTGLHASAFRLSVREYLGNPCYPAVYEADVLNVSRCEENLEYQIGIQLSQIGP